MEMASSAYRPVRSSPLSRDDKIWETLPEIRPWGSARVPKMLAWNKNCDFQVQFWVFTGRCFCWKLPAGNLCWRVPVDALGQRSCDQERSWHRAILWLCVQGQEGARRRLLVGGGLLPPAVLGSVNEFIARQAQVLWRRARGTGRRLWDAVGVQTRAHRRAASPGPGGGDLGEGGRRVRPTCPGSGLDSVPRKRLRLPRGRTVPWPQGWWPACWVRVCPWSPLPPESSQGQAEGLREHTSDSPGCRWLPEAQSLF